jgi:hypothetical protein
LTLTDEIRAAREYVLKEFMGWQFAQLALNTELPWRVESSEPE